MSGKLLHFFLLTSILLAGCIRNNPGQDKITIGFSQCTVGDEWRRTMVEEMIREINLYREVEMELIVKDARDSNEQQIKDINDLLKMGIDLLIVSPNESEPLTPVIEEVFNSGIPVINIDRKINSEEFTAYIGADNFMIGQEAGKVAAQLLENRGKILEVTGLEGSSAAIERSSGFREILDQFPDIEIVSLEGEWLHEVALERADTLFRNNKDINLVFAHNDPMAYGAYLSAEKNNIQPFILGVDGLYVEDGGVDMVLQGIFTCTFLYPTGGDEAIQLAYKILNKEPYKKYNFLNTLTIDASMARTMKLQGIKITKQQEKIDNQLDYIGEIGVLLKQRNIVLLFSASISALLLILGSLAFRFLILKNRIYRSVDGKNKMINEQNVRLSEQRDNLVNLLKIAEEANEEKLRFFTNISHEFRTLISLISMPLNLLLEYNCSEEIREKLIVMSKNANRLSNLAHEILRFRKIDTNKYKLNFQESDIVEFIMEVTNTFKPKAQEKGVVLTADLPSELVVEFDSAAMEKVLFNLVLNAIKHTEKNGIVYIKLEHDNHFVKIIIQDTGSGIPKEEIPLIFDRFYRGSYNIGDEDNNTGMGIGLALCKELLSLHGGTIKVKSKEGRGSTFTATIPLSYKPTETEQKELLSAKNHPFIDTDYHSDKTVLIVEDNSELRSVISELVGKYYVVDEAVDGLDGFKKAIERVPDLIISDILMPVMDGIQMTTELKKHPSTFHIPVILLTAIDSQESTIRGFNTGADAYIVKPFNETLFIKRIQNLIDSHTRIKHKYGKDYFSTESYKIDDHNSKEFVNQLITIIYDNVSNESYSLNKLALDMNLSRSSLYRKIKDITGMKAVDFMKKAKLQYAARLLIHNDYTINEVAWRTGFSDPRYFSKCFYKEYGQVPSKFKESNSLQNVQ